MNATATSFRFPVPEPPARCAYGHTTFTTGADYIEGGVMIGYSACTACEDLAAHVDAYQEWLDSDAGARWHEMDEAPPIPDAEIDAMAAALCVDFVLVERTERPRQAPTCPICHGLGLIRYASVPHEMPIRCPCVSTGEATMSEVLRAHGVRR